MNRDIVLTGGNRKGFTTHHAASDCLSLAVRIGAKLHGLQWALGHALVATTGSHVHTNEGELEQVVAVMPSVLGRWE